MSSEVRINDSPRHFMVLDAIARGMQDPNKIAKVLKINKEEVELIVNDSFDSKTNHKKGEQGFFW